MPSRESNTYAERVEQARERLDRLGAGQEMTKWVDYVPEQLGRLRALGKQLGNGILASTGYAYYDFNGEIMNDWAQAREAVAQYLLDWENHDLKKRPPLAAIAAVSRQTLECADKLNHLKVSWEQLHGDIRLVAGFTPGGDYSTQQASEAMRSLLRLINENRLNLDATDRKVPLIIGVPLAVRWFRANARPTARRTVAELVAALREVRATKDNLTPDDHQALDFDIVKFASMDPETPIAFRLRASNDSQRWRASYLDGKIRRSLSGYAGSPILCLHHEPVISPALSIYEEKGTASNGKPKNTKAMGPRVRVTDDPVVNEAIRDLGELRFYSWYRDKRLPEPKAEKKAKKNPYAATPFPGLWLGARKVKGGLAATIIVQLLNRDQRRFSIDKYGLARAWALAAETYSADRDINLDAVIARQPTMQAVNDMLAWADNMTT